MIFNNIKSGKEPFSFERWTDHQNYVLSLDDRFDSWHQLEYNIVQTKERLIHNPFLTGEEKEFKFATKGLSNIFKGKRNRNNTVELLKFLTFI